MGMVFQNADAIDPSRISQHFESAIDGPISIGFRQQQVGGPSNTFEETISHFQLGLRQQVGDGFSQAPDGTG